MQNLMTMNIRSPKGTAVQVYHEDEKVLNGTDYDKVLVHLKLDLNKIYHVDYTEVGDWTTKVYLIEVPGIVFNSVNFKEVK